MINASDGSTATVLAYAPFDNGHVIYFGGHNQTDYEGHNTPERAAIFTDALLLSNTTKIVPAYTLHFNASLNYSDGSTNFYKELNISARRTIQNATKDIVSDLSNSHLEVDFVYPQSGYVLDGNVSVQVSGNGSSTYFEMSGLDWVAMNNVGGDLWNITVNTSEYSDGEHIFAAKTLNGSNYAYESISVTFDNGGGSEPGVGADWEGTLDIESCHDEDWVEIDLEVWEDEGENIPLSDADVNITVKRKAPEEVIYTDINGITYNGTLEGKIMEDSNDAIWSLMTGASGSDDNKNLGSWDFKKNKKYIVIAEVEKDGKTQYFEKEFQF